MEHLRKTVMFLPTSNPNMLEDVVACDADSIMFDLEDTISLVRKGTSRFLVSQTVKTLDFSSTEIIVRINSLDASDVDGVYIMIRAGVDIIRLPKATYTRGVLDAEEVTLETEKACGCKPDSTRVMAAIEDPHGALDATAIAHSSECLIDITLGSEDYVTAVETRRYADRNGEEILFARPMIVHAARAAEIIALDTIFADVNGMETLQKETEFVRQPGFDGKSAVRPRQITVVNSVYTPSQKEISNAPNVFRVIEEANTKDSSIITLNDEMIGEPFIKHVGRVFTLAKVVGVYTGSEGWGS